MTLIKSISGIRGTIGGKPGNILSPDDIVKFTAAYCSFIQKAQKKENVVIVVGRDARVSGPMVSGIVCSTLQAMGADIIDIGLTTTPTAEMAVTQHKTDGGIILTASHNPAQWNALKLLNHKGEFLSADEGEEILISADSGNYSYTTYDKLGSYREYSNAINDHIDDIIKLSLVDVKAIKEANFKVAIDCVNSTGGISLPPLLKALGVSDVIELYCEPNGLFPHNPEPIPENLTEIAKTVKNNKADIGFVVDPDVDRLAIVCEDGSMFGEEYTLVAVADYILSKTKGNSVSNMSSTRALRDVTEKHGGKYESSAVGEVNVVEKMKATNAIIGGEGNGGVIFPELHYGRDALLGIALILTYLAKTKKSTLELRKSYPNYVISKNKIELEEGMDVDKILENFAKKYANLPHSTIDGVKVEFGKEWVHLRKSNTEPIIRIYAESENENTANQLAKKVMAELI